MFYFKKKKLLLSKVAFTQSLLHYVICARLGHLSALEILFSVLQEPFNYNMVIGTRFKLFVPVT